MVARAAIAVTEDALEGFDQLSHADIESGFFLQLAPDTLDKGFTQLKRAAGDRPCALERFSAAPDQQHAVILDHHTANAHHRPVGIFALAIHAQDAKEEMLDSRGI